MNAASEIMTELIALSRWLGEPARDLAILGEGNTSARLDDDTFLVKASGHNLETIGEDGFCAARFSRLLPAFDGPELTDAEVRQTLRECKAGGDPDVMPSVETFLHAYLLTLPNVNYVGHCHPTAVNAILCARNVEAAIAGRLYPDEIVCCGIAPCYVEYTDPGMPLAKHLRTRVEAFHAQYGEWPKTILMQNHGLIAVGRTPKDVRATTAMYVKAARVLLGTYALGGPDFLTDANVSRIHTRPDEHYRQQQIARK